MTGVSNTISPLSVSNIFVTKRGNFLALRARLYMEAEALQEKTKKNEYNRTLRAFYKFCFWSFGKDKAPQKSQNFAAVCMVRG